MPKQNDLITLAALRDRGWTPAMVKNFLGAPDQTKQNPHYASAAPMKLYALSRVEAVEATEEFRAARDLACRRQATAKAAAKRRADELLAAIDSMPVNVKRLDAEKLLSAAIDNYNSLPRTIRRDGWANRNSPPDFLARIQVNFIRHCLTTYELELDRVYSEVGAPRARRRIKKKVLQAIAEAYPSLADECDRQSST